MSRFDCQSARLAFGEVDQAALSGLVSRIRDDLSKHSWSSDFASFLLPETSEYLDASVSMAREFSNCETLVIVGIG